jgi:glycosyltransferase involved in cell wall biosynthesis
MKGRVLCLLENMPFPADRRIRQEAFDLAAAGYDVTVISPLGPGADEREADVNGVRALRYPVRLSQGGARGYLREYADAVVGVSKIVRRLRREAPFNVVIAANPPDFLIQLARPFRRRGAGLIFDYHDPAPELFEAMFERRGLLHRLLIVLERRAERTADLVMTVNEPCADLVRSRGGIAAENVYVIYNGPDPARFYPVEPLPELRNGREHLVLWVGQMSRKEGLGYLLDAAEELVKVHRREDVSFAIVGDGEIRQALESEAAARGLAGVISLPGHVGDEALREYMSTASVCVSLDEHSALNDRSLMIKVLEYMIMGRAIVQFPLKEVSRVCGDTTLYAATGDAHDLAAKISELLDDPERRETLGRAARERLLDGLTWPDQVPTLLSAVERAAAIGQRRLGGDAPRRRRRILSAEEQ